ncbi:hypothetical protein AAZX31_10G188500 [Glycine max]
MAAFRSVAEASLRISATIPETPFLLIHSHPRPIRPPQPRNPPRRFNGASFGQYPHQTLACNRRRRPRHLPQLTPQRRPTTLPQTPPLRQNAVTQAHRGNASRFGYRIRRRFALPFAPNRRRRLHRCQLIALLRVADPFLKTI